MSQPRTCALEPGPNGEPGCLNPISSRRKNTKFCCEAHRQEAYRRRVRAAATAAGLPANLSLKTVEQSTPTENRSGDARSRRKSGQSVRISYRKAVEAVGQHLALVQDLQPGQSGNDAAREILDPLLTERQKEALRDAA